MPLFLKALDPSIDILGNEQVLKYNADQINNDANLLLLNAFTANAGIFPLTGLSFANSNLKGFRFHHESLNNSIYGNFSLQTYDKFGTGTNIFKYNELTDSVSFFKNVSLLGLSFTGNLSLNSNKITNLANGTVNTDAVNLGQLNSSITALGFSGLSANGFLVRAAGNTYLTRNIAVGTGLNVTNSDGVAGNPTISVANIPINTLSGYPSNSSLFLNGLGSWSVPVFPNLITTNNPIFSITLNNTNSASTGTGLLVQNNGVSRAEFGFNNSTNEAYVWALGTASLKFGTADTLRMQLLNNGTLDLLTNAITTSGNINATTGTLRANNLAAHSSSSISVANSLAMNNNYITGLATPINNQDAATKQYVDNNSGGAAQSIMHGFNNSTYSTNAGQGDHLKFDGVAFVRGTNISLDSSSPYSALNNTASLGRITLAAGKTYKLVGSINNVVSANFNATRWVNSDTGGVLGLTSGAPSPISTTDRVAGAGTVAYITTSVATRVELRITWNSFASVNGTGDSIGTSWFTVEEV